jgi:photosystem I subunit 12
MVWFLNGKLMGTSITQTEVLIALIVAAHAGVLAVRLCFSLYKA